MGWMPQPKDKDWPNGYKNKTPLYAAYKRPTSKQGTHTDWKWRAGKRYSMQIEGSCFCIHSASLCLLVGAFNPFTFKVSMIPLPFTLLFWVRVYTPFLCFLSREYLRICWRAGLVVLNSLSFYLSVKIFIPPSYWMRPFLGTVIWAVCYFLSSL